MTTLGEQLWHGDGRTASLRLLRLSYAARCESKQRCGRRATVGLECRDRIGHPIWRRDLCEAHAQPLIAKARARSIETYWHGDLPEAKALLDS